MHLRGSLGLRRTVLDDPDRPGAAWGEALSASRPCWLDAHFDPSVAPISSDATFGQMLDTGEARLEGDENRLRNIVEGIRTKLQELLPYPKGPD